MWLHNQMSHALEDFSGTYYDSKIYGNLILMHQNTISSLNHFVLKHSNHFFYFFKANVTHLYIIWSQMVTQATTIITS